VIQARLASDAVGYCQKHSVDVLVADVCSLEPLAVDALRSIREAQPHAGVLLISGYDRFQVNTKYPSLLDYLYFLQKPFSFTALGVCLRLIFNARHVQEAEEILASYSCNSS